MTKNSNAWRLVDAVADSHTASVKVHNCNKPCSSVLLQDWTASPRQVVSKVPRNESKYYTEYTIHPVKISKWRNKSTGRARGHAKLGYYAKKQGDNVDPDAINWHHSNGASTASPHKYARWSNTQEEPRRRPVSDSHSDGGGWAVTLLTLHQSSTPTMLSKIQFTKRYSP